MHQQDSENVKQQQPEIVGIVNQICEILIRNGRQPEVYISKWYDICVHSSSISHQPATLKMSRLGSESNLAQSTEDDGD